MITYEKPAKGIYKHTVTNYDGTFTSYNVRVEVIGENDKSYYIKLLEPTTTRMPGDFLWVRRRSITLTDKPVIPSADDTEEQKGEPWWNRI